MLPYLTSFAALALSLSSAPWHVFWYRMERAAGVR
jgi:hypothetical protein